MKNLFTNCSQRLPFVSFREIFRMLHINFKKLVVASLAVFVCSSILFATNSWAEDPSPEAVEAAKKVVGTAASGMSNVIHFGHGSGSSGPLFGDLAAHGGKIFTGLREIIYAVSGFGIIAVVIGSIFGNINYKWLTAILIGLFVIAATAAIINYMVEDTVITTDMITDSLKTGG